MPPSDGDDPMARDEQADRVAPDGATDRACRPRGADLPGDLAVARGPAPGDRRHGLEDTPVPGRPVGQVEGDGAPDRAPGEQALERGQAGIEVDPPRIARRGTSRAFSTGDAEPLRQLGVECRLRGQPRDGDDAAVGGGEVERSPRARDRRADDGACPACHESRTDGPMVYSQGV